MQLQQTVQEGQDSRSRCPLPNMASTTEEGWHWINTWSGRLHTCIHKPGLGVKKKSVGGCWHGFPINLSCQLDHLGFSLTQKNHNVFMFKPQHNIGYCLSLCVQLCVCVRMFCQDIDHLNPQLCYASLHCTWSGAETSPVVHGSQFL